VGFRAFIALLFPFAILILFIMLQVGAPTAATNPFASGQGSAAFCSYANGTQNCSFAAPPKNSTAVAYVLYHCTNFIGPCQVLPTCIPDVAVYSGLWCFPVYLRSGLIGNPLDGTWLNAGQYALVPKDVAAASEATARGSAFFGFSNTNLTLMFVGFIGVLIGVGSLAGLTVFGSGLNSESIQIIIQGAFIMGLWTLLAGLEGVGGNDVFSQMNAVYGFGNILFALCTLSVLFGFAGTISRSGV